LRRRWRCRGGGGGGGGTGSFSVGPITGIGSIIVNGIRYDDSTASISNDDSTFRREDFRLGMVMAVQGSPVINGQSTATRIAVISELVGPISAIDASGFTVLGQTVTVDASTVFDPRIQGALAGLRVGQAVEVYGIADPAGNSLRATYIEREDSPNEYRLQGRVTAQDGIAKTFSIGSLNMNYAATDSDDVRVTPALGALVRVRLAVTLIDGVYLVNRIRPPEDAFGGFVGGVEFRGTITSFTSLSSFSVNNVPVNASQALFREGTTGIAAGAFVEVEGRLDNGVFVATSVRPDDDGAGAVGGGTEFELRGTVSGATTSGSGGSFMLTSSGGVVVAVDWLNGIEFRDGAAASLTNGRRVEFKGSLTSGGTRVNATRISFDS
jgi:hypothetical protein